MQARRQPRARSEIGAVAIVGIAVEPLRHELIERLEQIDQPQRNALLAAAGLGGRKGMRHGRLLI